MTLSPILDGLLVAVVSVAAITDLRSGRVPNWLTYPGVVAGLVGWGLMGGWSGLGTSAVGLMVGFVPLFFFYRAGVGLKGGDVKLVAAVGALRGWPFILFALFYGFIVAAVLGVVLMVKEGKTRDTLRRIGRTLKSVLLPGREIVSPASPESVQVPFAVCLCLGVMWALIEVILKRTLWEAIRSVMG